MKETRLTTAELRLVTGGVEDQSGDDKNKWKDRFDKWHWNTCTGLAGPGMICEGCTTAPKNIIE